MESQSISNLKVFINSLNFYNLNIGEGTTSTLNFNVYYGGQTTNVGTFKRN